MRNKIPKCQKFTGYKPCYPDHNCWTDGCKDEISIGEKLLIINLDAMGDVLMTTAQLPALKRKFPTSTIYWVTLKNAKTLLYDNPFIYQVFEYNAESISILSQMKFDHVMNVDKSQRSCALLNILDAKNKLGFGLNEDGKIIPMNKGSYYNYNLGMDDNLKFKINTRTGQDYLAETLELDYKNEEYILNFTEAEEEFIKNFKIQNKLTDNDFIVGFNTGCSPLYPNKKMTVEQHISLIKKLISGEKYKIALFGGPEDTERNREIYSHFNGELLNTPTTEGVRKGALYESIADVIITGDSFGMHLAIALKKYVIAWFGVSCWNEINLYGRGVKLYQDDLECSPCWKQKCPYNLECIKQIDMDRIIIEVDLYFEKRK